MADGRATEMKWTGAIAVAPVRGCSFVFLGLWEALRECRQSFANEHNVPAYVIFHDKTLHEMLTYRPQTAAELLGISGVGQTKLDRYGDGFLSILREEVSAVQA